MSATLCCIYLWIFFYNLIDCGSLRNNTISKYDVNNMKIGKTYFSLNIKTQGMVHVDKGLGVSLKLFNILFS